MDYEKLSFVMCRGKRQDIGFIKVLLKDMGCKDITDYRSSGIWKERREKFMAGKDRGCYVCDKDQGLSLHHRTYETIGYEGNFDCFWLCGSCHPKAHKDIELLKGAAIAEDEAIDQKKIYWVSKLRAT